MNRRIKWPVLVIALEVLVIAVLLIANLPTAGDAAYEADTPLHISLNNIEIEEIYYQPQLHGSVAVDRQTGVMYWISEAGEATLLVNEKGKPRLWGAQ